MREFLIGRLNTRALPHDLAMIGGSIAIISSLILVSFILTRTKRWRWLWKEWLTSVDPKRIGIMYFIVGGLMPHQQNVYPAAK